MKKGLKIGLCILLAIVIVIVLARLVRNGIHRDYLTNDGINYYLIIVYIILLIGYFVLIFNTFKPQKWYKRILIFVLSFIFIHLLFIILSVIGWLISLKTNLPSYLSHGYIVEIISLITSIYLAFLLRAHRIEDSTRKKRLKKILLIILPFMLIVVWAGLTKAGDIPNFADLDILDPGGGKVRSIHMDYGCSYNDSYYDSERGFAPCAEKPIIYLYPTEETQVNVTLGTPENLLHTYPKYNAEKGWNVVAEPNGDLKDMDTGRKLYALYREGKTYAEDNFEEGFVVKGEDTISFLEEKLAILGLNEREAEELIVYWLPQMENNEYNLIRFETKEEQDENMPLNITPTPDTVIRVMMDWKAIDEPIDIPEQELTTPERTGFTVVEWGGSPRN